MNRLAFLPVSVISTVRSYSGSTGEHLLDELVGYARFRPVQRWSCQREGG